MKYLILLALASCATTVTLPLDSPTQTCKTKCGLYTNNYHGTCQELKNKEGEILSAFKEVDPDVCDMLNGWHLLFVNSENGMFQINKQYVFGATVLDDKMILLGTLDALPHEVGHVMDRNLGIRPELSARHAGWRQDKWCDIIGSLSKLDINCDSAGEGK